MQKEVALFILDGGMSKRFHTSATIKEQNIAAHSFGVAWWCELLSGGMASKNLIMAALAHDLAEHQVGDVPAPAKRKYPAIKQLFDTAEEEILRDNGLHRYYNQLSSLEKDILKMADAMEGAWFCLYEMMLGNKFAGIMFERFLDYYAQTAIKYDDKIFNELGVFTRKQKERVDG